MKNLCTRHALAALTLAVASPAWSQTSTDDARMRALEERITELETAPTQGTPASASAFNPAVSLILSGLYSNLSRDPGDYRVTGFPLPAEAEVGPGTRGFSLAESELGIAANIDPEFYGSLAYALGPDGSASVEEAYIQTLALAHGVTVKAGRYFSGIGYLNAQHAHLWDFVDAPLAYQAFLGTQFGDDGVQVKWLAPTDRFLEFGAELGRGAPYPGSDSPKNGAGAATIFVHTGDDVGISHSWRAGLSWLTAAPRGREVVDTNLSGDEVTNLFSGETRLWIADFVWQYAPSGHTVQSHLKVQGEYVGREDQGDLTYDLDNVGSTARYDARQAGWYVQAIYQFRPNWRVGVRTDQLQHGTVDYGANSANLKLAGFDPSRNAIMVDYSPSEFSRLRLQFAQDKAQRGVTDNQAFLQYQVSIGAHGAHSF